MKFCSFKYASGHGDKNLCLISLRHCGSVLPVRYLIARLDELSARAKRYLLPVISSVRSVDYPVANSQILKSRFPHRFYFLGGNLQGPCFILKQ